MECPIILGGYKMSYEEKNIDINSKEGWNEYVRRANIQTLVKRGIEPTEENLKKYQDKVNREVKELLKNIPEHHTPIVYRL